MNKEIELWQFIVKRLKQQQSVFLLIVAESKGSSPGRQGFKMAVAEDGLFGSIGGGVMEVSLVELAKEKRQKKQGKGTSAEIIEQTHRENSQSSSGMICSGKQTVILFELNPDYLETAQEIISAIDDRKLHKLLITNTDVRVTEFHPKDSDFTFEREIGNTFIYEEKLGFKNKLFIVGGGHCALALSELMSAMDFHISLFDDRPELNTLAKNEFVHAKNIIETYEQIDEHIASGENHYIVVMTLGYEFDEIVIRKLFNKDFKYFGVLGSRAKMAVLIRELTEEGFDKDRLEKIYTPIGISINSRTPEEIAISIAAEIIAVKNSKE